MCPFAVTPTAQIPTSKPSSSQSPGKPKNVNAYAKSASEMFVSWQLPDQTNGVVTSYNVFYLPKYTLKSGRQFNLHTLSKFYEEFFIIIITYRLW